VHNYHACFLKRGKWNGDGQSKKGASQINFALFLLATNIQVIGAFQLAEILDW
jgi:hypothetical protein